MSDDYDVIVIGSGMGGLAVASLGAQLAHRRVLVLERHFKAGGFTHDFQRGRFHWDVGLHYVGELGEKSRTRHVMDLVTGGAVAWAKMPDPVERFVYPELTFDVPVGEASYLRALIDRFPDEEDALRRYFKRLGPAASGVALRLMQRSGSRPLRGLAAVMQRFRPDPGSETTKDVLESSFRNPELRAVLASIWGTYGLPPEHSAFAIHALITQHYLNGAWYPVGGAGRIAASVNRIVEAAGGRIVVQREVTEVLVENGRAVGVRARSMAAGRQDEIETFRAPAVVSDAGAANTWCRLVPRAHAEPHRSVLSAFLERHPASTCVTLYLGLEGDPRTLGFRGENHWIYASLDHDALFRARRDWLSDGDPAALYLSFPSLKDPEAEAHTAEVVCITVDYGDFERWKDERWLRRGHEYDAFKKSIADRILAMIERRYPGFSALVKHAELSTPITNEHFVNHARGRIYGLPLVPELFRGEVARATHPRTSLPGLYLTGADAGLFGIVGALMTGVTTLSNLPGGPSMVRVFSAAGRAAAAKRA